MNDPAWRANTRVDPEHQHEINVAVINAALKDKPADMAVTVHMCRGNYQSAWFSTGGYDFVAEAVFGGLRVDGLFLEYDDERSGSFEPLRFHHEPATTPHQARRHGGRCLRHPDRAVLRDHGADRLRPRVPGHLCHRGDRHQPDCAPRLPCGPDGGRTPGRPAHDARQRGHRADPVRARRALRRHRHDRGCDRRYGTGGRRSTLTGS